MCMEPMTMTFSYSLCTYDISYMSTYGIKSHINCTVPVPWYLRMVRTGIHTTTTYAYRYIRALSVHAPPFVDTGIFEFTGIVGIYSM